MTDAARAASDDEAARRSRLLGVKLRALVRDHLGVDRLPEPVEFAPGAALIDDDRAWILLDDRPGERLGAALLWARRQGATSVDLIAEQATGQLARRASSFSTPITVWHADDRVLLPTVAEPLSEPAPPPAHHEEFRARIVEGGAEPGVEHGVLDGEVRGLEVCRVVDDPVLGTTRLEVGVGAHDREAFQMLHGDVPTAESLARVVDAVAQHRRVEAPQHPLNRLAAERFVRWRLIDEPAIIGFQSIVAAQPPVPRINLKDPVPCVAAGVATDGGQAVIVCSSGVDLDLIPFAADARSAQEAIAGGPLDLVVVLPGRDLVRATTELAADLDRPARFVPLD